MPTILTSIIDPLYPAPKLPYLLCIATLDGWFGIPFKDTNCFTNVRSPCPSKILTLYGLSALIPLYPYTTDSNIGFTPPSLSCVKSYY